MIFIDAKGKNCPIPVVMTKKAMDAGADELTVEVDNPVAVANVSKLADTRGFAVSKEEITGGFRLLLAKGSDASCITAAAAAGDSTSADAGKWVLFVGQDSIGSGSKELGESLMKMFFYTLAESDDFPSQILFINEGVRLPVFNEDVVGHLKTLAAQGVEILVCGTCLNYYKIAEQLKVGTISNMFDIVSRMQTAAKVVTL